MKRVLQFTILGIIFASCSTTKTLNIVTLRDDLVVVNHVHDPQAAIKKHDIEVRLAPKGQKVKIDLEEDKLRLIFLKKKDVKVIDKINIGKNFAIPDESGFRLADKYAYFDVLEKIKPKKTLEDYDKLNGNVKINYKEKLLEDTDFTYTLPIKYTNHKGVLQTFTIPFKLRPEVNDFPSTVTAGFNAGIAYGYQISNTTLKPIYEKENGKMQGYDRTTTAFALAPFGGITTVSLSPSNTNESIETDRTVLGLSFGGTGVLTFNRFNIGLALGWDFGLEDSKNWVYQGELWTGIVIGLDLIK